MTTYSSGLGIPVSRQKSFSVLTSFCRSDGLILIADATGESIAETLGRVMLVFDWMARYAPSGVMPAASTIKHQAYWADRTPGARKRSDTFAKAFIEILSNGDECAPFAEANAAAFNTRQRQREQMQRRRSK